MQECCSSQKLELKILLTISLLFTAFAGFSQSVDELNLSKTLKEFHTALVNKNTVSINQQTDKALSYGHSNGWVETKADLLKNLQSGYLVYQSYKEDSLAITLNGNLASARFIADIAVQLNGNPGMFHLKVLEVWQKKGNRWVLFARQAVKVD